MTPEEHPDWARVQKIVKEFFSALIEAQEEHSAEILLDDFGIVAAFSAAIEEDGDQSIGENVGGYFSSKKGHVQVGLLEMVLEKSKREYLAEAEE